MLSPSNCKTTNIPRRFVVVVKWATFMNNKPLILVNRPHIVTVKDSGPLIPDEWKGLSHEEFTERFHRAAQGLRGFSAPFPMPNWWKRFKRWLRLS